MPRTSLAVLTLAALAVAGCSDPDGPNPPPPPAPLTVVASPATTDTVWATPIQALVVEVRNEQGELLSGITVRFTVLPTDGTLGGQPSMLVAAENATSYNIGTAVTTDQRGRAGALVRYGTAAGVGRIQIAVPQLGLADTVAFTINPGAAALVQLRPRDTTLGQGKSFQLRGGVVDAYGNVRSEPVVFSGPSGPNVAATVSPNGMVTAVSPGRVMLHAMAGSMRDSVSISVLPNGVVAGFDGANFIQVELDGSARTVLTKTPVTPSLDLEPSWSTDGSAIVFIQHGFPYVIDVATGNVDPVLPSVTTVAETYWPEFSPDGRQIFFSANSPTGISIWRVDRNGGGLTQVTHGSFDARASFAPDGRAFAYHSATGSGLIIRIFEMATGQHRPFDVPGIFPEWSPDGEWIAYLTLDNALHIIRPDGTGDRELLPAHVQQQQFTWSPDGTWLLLRRNGVELIRVADPAPVTTVRVVAVSLGGIVWRPY